MLRSLRRTVRALGVALRLSPREKLWAVRDAYAAWRLTLKERTGNLGARDAVQLARMARHYRLDPHDLWSVWEYHTAHNLDDAVTKALEIQALYRRKPGPITLN